MSEIAFIDGSNSTSVLTLPLMVLFHGRVYALNETNRRGLILRAQAPEVVDIEVELRR